MSKIVNVQISLSMELEDNDSEKILMENLRSCLSNFGVTYKDISIYTSPMWRIIINDDGDFAWHEIEKVQYPVKKSENTFYSIEDAKKCFIERGYETEEQARVRYYEELGWE